MRRRQRLDVEKKRSQIKARRPEWRATDGMIKDKGETLESHVGFCGDHMDWLAMEEWGAARRRGKRRRHGGADDGRRSRWNARIRMNARCGVILMLLHSEASEKSWILFRALRRDSRRPWRGKPGSRAFFFDVAVKWCLSTVHHALQLTIWSPASVLQVQQWLSEVSPSLTDIKSPVCRI